MNGCVREKSGWMKRTVSSRNAKKMLICLTMGVILFAVLCCIDYVGSMPRIEDDVEGLSFSRPSGFYDCEFDLNLSSETGEIFYTLDSSVPDESSYKYTEPIHIYDNSSDENRYASRDDVSVRFYADLIEETGQNPPGKYVPLTDKVDKAMVVRARIHYPDNTWSDTKSAVYFIGYQERHVYDGFDFVSILTDPDNLYDYENGIYVNGKTLDDFLLSGDYKNTKWREWPTNYRNRGKDWEKAVDCQFFDKDKKLRLSQNMGIRIHGAVSRTYYQKGFSLRAKKKYDGNDRILLRLFSDNEYYSKLTLSNGGNDHDIKIKDYIMEDLCNGLDFVTTEFKPVVTFLDGEFWGLYYLTQKYDDTSLYKNRYGVRDSNLIIIKDGMLEQGREADYILYGEMIDFCSTADMSNLANYQKACEYIDMESCIDYFATMIYIARWSDWPYANLAMWRVRESQGGAYTDGRWRYVFFDLNGDGFTEDLIEADPFEMAMKDPVFSNLYKNEKFRQKLNSRILELGETVFSPKRFDDFIKNKYEPIINQIVYTAVRFGDDEKKTRVAIESDEESIRKFFYNREEFLKKKLK